MGEGMNVTPEEPVAQYSKGQLLVEIIQLLLTKYLFSCNRQAVVYRISRGRPSLSVFCIYTGNISYLKRNLFYSRNQNLSTFPRSLVRMVAVPKQVLLDCCLSQLLSTCIDYTYFLRFFFISPTVLTTYDTLSGEENDVADH